MVLPLSNRRNWEIYNDSVLLICLDSVIHNADCQSVYCPVKLPVHGGGCSLQSAGIIWVQFFTNKYNQNIWQMVLTEWQHNDTQKVEVSKAFINFDL